MIRFFRLCLVAYLLSLGLGSGAATAAEPQAFAYSVICDDPALAQRLRAGVEERFAKLHVLVRDRFPNFKLFIYASRDTNDDRNPEGVSVAVAHVSNMKAALLALSYIHRNEAPPALLQSMLGDEGMLLHLNVGHLSSPSDPRVNELLDRIVTNFVQKYSPLNSQPEASTPAPAHH